MTVHKVDVVIIGAGTAGMRAFKEVSKVTDSILLIESGQYGTTCARVGCMPSKLLIAAAEAAHAGKHSDLFGVHYEPPKIDGCAVMARVRSERDRFVGFVVEAVEAWPVSQRVKAMARFVSDHELSLDNGDTVVAQRVVIAVGSRPNIPQVFEGFGDRMLTSDDIFYWENLPRSVVVFGAGIVGLELGQALSRLGVRVTLLGRSNSVGPLTDPDVKASATSDFTETMDFRGDARVLRHALNADGDGVEVDVETSDGVETLSFDHALIATGRLPNTDRLGLDHTGIALDRKGVPLFDVHTGRCGDSHIFIAGDADNEAPLLHEAADDGQIAGFNAGHYPAIRRFSRRASISVMFTDPQIMMIGRTWRDLSESDTDFETGSVDWSDQGRARVMNVNTGLLRVYGERQTGKFLGAEMFGPRAENIAHLLAWARQAGMTVGDMIDMPFYHPVLEEGVRTALRNLNYALGMGKQPPARCLDCGPGG